MFSNGLSTVNFILKVGESVLTLKYIANLVPSLLKITIGNNSDSFDMWNFASWVARLTINYTLSQQSYNHIVFYSCDMMWIVSERDLISVSLFHLQITSFHCKDCKCLGLVCHRLTGHTATFLTNFFLNIQWLRWCRNQIRKNPATWCDLTVMGQFISLF